MMYLNRARQEEVEEEERMREARRKDTRGRYQEVEHGDQNEDEDEDEEEEIEEEEEEEEEEEAKEGDEDAGGEIDSSEVHEHELLESDMQERTQEQEEVVEVHEFFHYDTNAYDARKVHEGDEELGDMDTDYESEDCWRSDDEREYERRTMRRRMRQRRQEELERRRTVHLPPSLETLSISSKKPITFPSLPSTLHEIALRSDLINIMDRKLPSSLRVINFSGTFPSFVLFLSLCFLLYW